MKKAKRTWKLCGRSRRWRKQIEFTKIGKLFMNQMRIVVSKRLSLWKSIRPRGRWRCGNTLTNNVEKPNEAFCRVCQRLKYVSEEGGDLKPLAKSEYKSLLSTKTISTVKMYAIQESKGDRAAAKQGKVVRLCSQKFCRQF